MTAPPQTLAELDALLEKAKAAGIQPIQEWNAPNAGLAFPLQNLMGAYGDPEPINDWIFQKPGATIDTPANLQAAAAPRARGSRRATSRPTPTRSTTPPT